MIQGNHRSFTVCCGPRQATQILRVTSTNVRLRIAGDFIVTSDRFIISHKIKVKFKLYADVKAYHYCNMIYNTVMSSYKVKGQSHSTVPTVNLWILFIVLGIL